MRVVFLATVIFFLLASPSYAEDEKLHVYDHGGKRDPFVPLVGVTSGKVDSIEDIMSIEDVNLQGIAWDSTGKKTVIINGDMVMHTLTELKWR